MPHRRIHETELLSRIARALAESLELKRTLAGVLEALEVHMALQMGTINLLDPDSETIKIAVAHNIDSELQKQIEYREGEGITGIVYQTGEPMIVPDIAKDKRFLAKTGERKPSEGKKMAFICVPIKVEGKTAGAMSVSKETSSGKSLQNDARILNVIATMVGQAVKINDLYTKEKRGWQEENLKLRQQLRNRFKIHNMIGSSNAMQQVFGLVEQVAQSNATVMIRGESGTGKDLIAHAIHYSSLRADKPFIKINCTALPESLLESELFGHEKGAFTGASDKKIGRFERAHGGTIFLDEIGDFSLNLQVKLLRAIQFKEFERVGGSETIKTNVRIVVATNRNLEEDIKNGIFREDLYYRINVFPIFLPPLRERKDDIMLLADYFLEKYSKENSKNITRLSTPAINMLTSYHWPGNIRELENCIERAVLLCNEEVIRSEHLPPSLQFEEAAHKTPGRTLPEMVENLEREMIVDALKKNKGQQRKAAEQLGLTERMMGYKIKKYNIYPKQIV
ncbi:sigma-54-dependent Fis family transcriptional regulator [Sedimentisphaera salicampi]|uniref:Nif-specific regulatory protein n=1 Tax=Sedimentisphaera salicampi TaxID=1941349 RepID=A0A1W6LMZ2_9BACT|nr:sigma 54-interacting transcriptional regulator [Sedimentisphaera salicampi]ARN57124.1 Nif-specific regulatory protein [Sedimentisphaera salicampi]OXU14769.1 Nif-specific regulatory protein [Sedimentisphaera salicampi]